MCFFIEHRIIPSATKRSNPESYSLHRIVGSVEALKTEIELYSTSELRFRYRLQRGSVIRAKYAQGLRVKVTRQIMEVLSIPFFRRSALVNRSNTLAFAFVHRWWSCTRNLQRVSQMVAEIVIHLKFNLMPFESTSLSTIFRERAQRELQLCAIREL